ncbi:MAG: GNAT family N-acetyltransferase, partial [Bacilli bacterium]
MNTINYKQYQLRDINNQDATQLMYLRSNKEDNYFNEALSFKTKAQALSFIKSIKEDEKLFLVQFIALTLSNDNKLIGLLSIYNYDYLNQEVEIGFEIQDSYQNKGHMSQVLVWLINYVFEDLGFKKIKVT